MKLSEIAEKAKGSKIWRLLYNRKVLGFRVKSYNVAKDCYEYYDFDIDIVKNIPEYLQFFKDNNSKLEYYTLKSVNGRLYTESELKGEYEASEITTKEETVNVLRPVILLYRGGVLSV